VVEVSDEDEGDKPILIEHNIMENSIIDHRMGNLLIPGTPTEDARVEKK
jgi:hypothetical protein